MNMEEPWTVEKIEDIITAEKLCAEIPKDSCVDNKTFLLILPNFNSLRTSKVILF